MYLCICEKIFIIHKNFHYVEREILQSHHSTKYNVEVDYSQAGIYIRIVICERHIDACIRKEG